MIGHPEVILGPNLAGGIWPCSRLIANSPQYSGLVRIRASGTRSALESCAETGSGLATNNGNSARQLLFQNLKSPSRLSKDEASQRAGNYSPTMRVQGARRRASPTS